MSSCGASALGNPRLRPLLPAPVPDESAVKASSFLVTSQHVAVPKRRSIGVACEECRRLKIKCDGVRPRCSKCAKRRVECVYNTLECETHVQGIKRKYSELAEKVSVYEELFDALRTRTEDESRMVLLKLRAGASPGSIVRQIKDGDLLLQLSLVPETCTRYDFPYISQMPRRLRTPTNIYLSSVLYEAACPSTASLSAVGRVSRSYHSPYVKPYHAAEMIDAQLADAKPSNWTAVSSNDAMLRRLLEKFFLHDYPRYVSFHKDTFLVDMKNGRHEHCSSLLVNAILASACRSDQSLPDRSRYGNPHGLAYKFFAEARRLWELEAGRSKLTTIQAALVMNTIYAADGVDRVGFTYLLQATAMAHDIKLFATVDANVTVWNAASRLFTAWGLFNWQAQHCYYLFRPPLLLRSPPPLPDPSPGLKFYPEILIRYPSDQLLFSLSFGYSFKVVCEFRSIMNDLTLELLEANNVAKKLSWERAISYRDRLEAWYRSLPPPLSPRSLIMPTHFTIHSEYYGMLVILFSVQTLRDDVNGEDAESRERLRKSQEIITDSLIQLETLLRLYYLRHGYEQYDPFAMHFLVLLANSALGAIQSTAESSLDLEAEESFRSTLVLCMKGIYDQSKNFYVAEVIYRLLQARLRAQDRSLIERYVSVDFTARDDRIMSQELQAQWVVPTPARNGDPDGSRLEKMTAEYQQLSMDCENEAHKDGL
ncbi:uncharacterized protein PV09_07918 [Verruconis gallopava]|uniref:Zn(2)-C6 fungal-type domain-containing protein n=1 Tax=Verruconis gallopava TaxID=253628 RepID=A0A0D2AN75_9PEZI|nr:uncharacterized protein PV09_07918 [Verruconis gallopava]KIW00564.1 hypothetical protein PV09_07918 [Verruconis gallopava]